MFFMMVVLAFSFAGCTTTKVVRETIEWSDFWWANEPDTSKPRVLFIGNSISKGYFPIVSKEIADVVNCDRYSTSRSIADPALIKETKIAMAKYQHAIIHFNNGLHGWHLNGDQYEEGLRKYVRFLKSHKAKGCKLVFSLTTPVPSEEIGVKLNPERNQIVIERNLIARNIMAENNIPVIDLYELMEPEIEKYSASKGNVHYNKDGYERIANRISEEILKLIPVNFQKQNTAIIPVPKLENDSYDWWDRHAEVLRIKDSINPEIVLIGNSITHFWGGEPKLKDADGKPRKPNGPQAWDSAFGQHRVLNLGFGWDRTQNVLWRLNHGELDGIYPRLVIIHIGTNNTSETENARKNTAPEIVEGISEICKKVRLKVPGAKIVLMAVMPREQFPDHPRRILINDTNRLLKIYAQEQNINFVDLGYKMLSPDGMLSKEIAGDFCHPTEKGYQIWADEIHSFVSELDKK